LLDFVHVVEEDGQRLPEILKSQKFSKVIGWYTVEGQMEELEVDKNETTLYCPSM
jgi:hypothetical protein